MKILKIKYINTLCFKDCSLNFEKKTYGISLYSNIDELILFRQNAIKNRLELNERITDALFSSNNIREVKGLATKKKITFFEALIIVFQNYSVFLLPLLSFVLFFWSLVSFLGFCSFSRVLYLYCVEYIVKWVNISVITNGSKLKLVNRRFVSIQNGKLSKRVILYEMAIAGTDVFQSKYA